MNIPGPHSQETENTLQTIKTENLVSKIIFLAKKPKKHKNQEFGSTSNLFLMKTPKTQKKP